MQSLGRQVEYRYRGRVQSLGRQSEYRHKCRVSVDRQSTETGVYRKTGRVQRTDKPDKDRQSSEYRQKEGLQADRRNKGKQMEHRNTDKQMYRQTYLFLQNTNQKEFEVKMRFLITLQKCSAKYCKYSCKISQNNISR